MLVPQKAPMRTEPENVNARIEPGMVKVRETGLENAKARPVGPVNANLGVNKPDNVTLRAAEPENLQMKTTESLIFESRGNEERGF